MTINLTEAVKLQRNDERGYMAVDKHDVIRFLIENAEKGNLLYYGELFNHFGMRTGPANDANPIPMFLGQIIKENAARKQPLLPSIVVNKEKDRPKDQLIPGDTYFQSLAEIRKIDIPKKKADKRRLHQAERDAVFAYYATSSGMLVEPE